MTQAHTSPRERKRAREPRVRMAWWSAHPGVSSTHDVCSGVDTFVFFAFRLAIQDVRVIRKRMAKSQAEILDDNQSSFALGSELVCAFGCFG